MPNRPHVRLSIWVMANRWQAKDGLLFKGDYSIQRTRETDKRAYVKSILLILGRTQFKGNETFFRRRDMGQNRISWKVGGQSTSTLVNKHITREEEREKGEVDPSQTWSDPDLDLGAWSYLPASNLWLTAGFDQPCLSGFLYLGNDQNNKLID